MWTDPNVRRQLSGRINHRRRMDSDRYDGWTGKNFQQPRQCDPRTRHLQLVRNPGNVRLQWHERSLDFSRLYDRRYRHAVNEREIMLVFGKGRVHDPADLEIGVSLDFAAELGREPTE